MRNNISGTTRLSKLVLGTLGLTLVVAIATGCNRPSGEGEGNEAIVIGFSQHRIAGSDWYGALIEGAKDQAEKQGVELLVSDAGGDATQQNADIQNFIGRGTDAVVVNALDPRGVGPALGQLQEDDTPYVAVNSKLSDDLHSQAFCYVAEDQEATGAKIGKALAKEVSSKYGSDERLKLAMIGGYSGEAQTNLRKEGFLRAWNEYFENNPGPSVDTLPIRYGEWLPDQALAPTQQIATANSEELAAVYSMSDVMLPGIRQGLQQAGVIDQVSIGSYDGAMAVVEQMKDNPKGPVQGTVSNTPYLQGAKAVQMAIEAVNEEDRSSACPGGTNHTESVLITPENAEEYYNPDQAYYYSEDKFQDLGSSESARVSE